MKKLLCLYISLYLFTGVIIAQPGSDERAAILVEHLKNREFKKGIDAMVAGTMLAEQDLSSLVSHLEGMHSQYGDIYSFERVFSLELGKVKKITYLIYCDKVPIKLEITEYHNEKKYQLLNIVFSDKVPDTVDEWGDIVYPSKK